MLLQGGVVKALKAEQAYGKYLSSGIIFLEVSCLLQLSDDPDLAGRAHHCYLPRALSQSFQESGQHGDAHILGPPGIQHSRPVPGHRSCRTQDCVSPGYNCSINSARLQCPAEYGCDHSSILAFYAAPGRKEPAEDAQSRISLSRQPSLFDIADLGSRQRIDILSLGDGTGRADPGARPAADAFLGKLPVGRVHLP